MASNNIPENTCLTDAEAHFRAIADQLPVMIWSAGTDKLCNWVNKSWLDFTGQSLNSSIDNGWADCIHPDDKDQSMQSYEAAFVARETFKIHFRLRRADGNYLWIQDNGAPRYADNGEFVGYIGSCTNIQSLKDLENTTALQSAELTHANTVLAEVLLEKDRLILEHSNVQHLYEIILATTPDFIYVISTDYRFTYANKVLLEMWGKTWDEAIGKTFLEIGYEPWHAELHNSEIDQVIRTKQPIRAEVPFNGTFGRRIYDYIFAPVFDENNEVIAIAGTTRDVTEKNQTQEALKRSEQALQLADKRKDEFLAMLAHELRNPLSPISAAAEVMMVTSAENERVRNLCAIIQRQVSHMVALVDDLLDVSRVTRGLVRIDKSPQSIATVLNQSIEQIKPFIDSKKQQLAIALPKYDLTVMGDKDRLVQIFSNILNNASKYTHPGGHISLTVEAAEGEVIIKIKDNGVGITEEDRQNIFELFAQAKRTSDRSQGGLGLGLALVTHMLKLHGGEVECFSMGLGEGSEFTVKLPLVLDTPAEIEEPKPEIPNKEATQALNIVVVDDNEDAAATLSYFLQLEGHFVKTFHNAHSGFAEILKSHPDLCVLDIGLPDMDGKELARRIKGNAETENIKLVALTGYGQQHDRINALYAGFDYFLVKPINIDEINKILESINQPS